MLYRIVLKTRRLPDNSNLTTNTPHPTPRTPLPPKKSRRKDDKFTRDTDFESEETEVEHPPTPPPIIQFWKLTCLKGLGEELQGIGLLDGSTLTGGGEQLLECPGMKSLKGGIEGLVT